MSRRQEEGTRDALMNIRMPRALKDRLLAASDESEDMYAPSMTSIIIRGIELALEELRKRNQQKPGVKP